MNQQFISTEESHRPTLIYEPLAYLVSTISHTLRVTIGIASTVTETGFESVKSLTSFSLSFYRSILVSTLSSAKNLHSKVSGTSNSDSSTDMIRSNSSTQGLFHRVLDHYTNMSIGAVNHGFSLVELLLMSTFHLTAKTVKLSLLAASATVHNFDGLFGSTETSRATAAFVQLVMREMQNEEEELRNEKTYLSMFFSPVSNTVSTILTLGSLSKALTAYACLYQMTIHRSQKQRKLITFHEGMFQEKEIVKDDSILIDESSSSSSVANMDRLKKKELLSAYEDDDGKSSVLVEWYEGEDNITTIEIEETTAGDGEVDMLNDQINDVEGINDIASCLRGNMETCDDAQTIISDAMDGVQEDVPMHHVLRPSNDTLATLIEDFSDERIINTQKHKQSKKGIKGFLKNPWGKSKKNEETLETENFAEMSSSLRSKSSKGTDQLLSTADYNGEFDVNGVIQPNGIKMLFDSSTTVQKLKNGSMKRKSIIKLLPDKFGDFKKLNYEKKSRPKNMEFNISGGPSTSDEKSFYPMPTLLLNIERFMKFSSSAYGLHFLRILGIGKIRDLQTEDLDHPADHYAFSIHSGVPLNCILSSSHTSTGESSFNAPRIKPVHNFVVLDHETRCVVVTFRGTLGLSDILLDLMCTYDDLTVGDNTHKVHAGMLRAARSIASKGPLFDIVTDTLKKYPNYGLILTGHSLGAGVAAILAILWSTKSDKNGPTTHVTNDAYGVPAGRSIHCYAYGSPCVTTNVLSNYCKGLVTTIINGDDLVATISIGLVRDLKSVSLQLLDPSNKGLAEKIIGRSLGFTMVDNQKVEEGSSANTHEEWFWGVMCELKGSMLNLKLFPAGDIFWLSSAKGTTVVKSDGVEKKILSHRIQLFKCMDVEMFGEPRWSKKMITDHSPSSYEDAISYLVKIMNQKKKKN